MTFVVLFVLLLISNRQLEMGIEPNPNRTNRTKTHILGRTEPI